LLGVGFVYAKYQLAEKLKVCCQDLLPILFNFRPSSSELWLQDILTVSGRAEDGVEILVSVLTDGVANHSANSVAIPKQAVAKDIRKYD
jgi:hypothetical protein